MFCLVRTEPGAAKHTGITYLLVEMKTPGIEVRPLRPDDRGGGVQRGVLHRCPRAREPGAASAGEGREVATEMLSFERGLLGSTLHPQRPSGAASSVLRQAGRRAVSWLLDRLTGLEGKGARAGVPRHAAADDGQGP